MAQPTRVEKPKVTSRRAVWLKSSVAVGSKMDDSSEVKTETSVDTATEGIAEPEPRNDASIANSIKSQDSDESDEDEALEDAWKVYKQRQRELRAKNPGHIDEPFFHLSKSKANGPPWICPDCHTENLCTDRVCSECNRRHRVVKYYKQDGGEDVDSESEASAGSYIEDEDVRTEVRSYCISTLLLFNVIYSTVYFVLMFCLYSVLREPHTQIFLN
jgi:hypothetical protein